MCCRCVWYYNWLCSKFPQYTKKCRWTKMKVKWNFHAFVAWDGVACCQFNSGQNTFLCFVQSLIFYRFRLFFFLLVERNGHIINWLSKLFKTQVSSIRIKDKLLSLKERQDFFFPFFSWLLNLFACWTTMNKKTNKLLAQTWNLLALATSATDLSTPG